MNSINGQRSLSLVLTIVLTVGILTVIPSAKAQSPENVTVTVMNTGDKFEIEASLSNGRIVNATLYPQYNYIVFDLTTSETDEGQLTVNLPRSLIDAKSEDQQSDGTFTVVLDDYETEYEELESSENQRTIVVPIGAGVVEATIVGTQVLPEFPAIILALVAGVISCIIVLSRLSGHPRDVQRK